MRPAARSWPSRFRMLTPEAIVVAEPGARALATGPVGRAREVQGQGRSSAGSARCARTACGPAPARAGGGAGLVRGARRLQATRSALGAMAAVGSICSRVSRWTTVSSSVCQGAPSICARTAIRRACDLVSRCMGGRLRQGGAGSSQASELAAAMIASKRSRLAAGHKALTGRSRPRTPAPSPEA